MTQGLARRVNGRHLLLPGGGAAIDVDGEPAVAQAEVWRRAVAELAEEHGLPAPVIRVRDTHVTLALPCPADRRLFAADVLDAVVDGTPLPASEPRDPRLLACLERAAALGLPAFFDEDGLTVGGGANARTWPRDALPDPDRVAEAGAIPMVLITGTNGKTTTANLVAAIGAAAGHRVGVATSNGVYIGGELVESGDWSGPGGTRRVLRDPGVTFAVLETARGGLMRRGLAVDGADVAIVTNASADHLGEWGLETVADLAEAKLVVAQALRPGGVLITRSNDAAIAVAAGAAARARPDLVRRTFSSTTTADARLDRGALWVDGDRVIATTDLPLSLGGAARHNVENALAAALAAHALGLSTRAIREGLASVLPDPTHNRGRTNLFARGGGRLLVDYAHNPDGLDRLGEMVRGLAPRRLLLLFGQAGDRPDPLVRELAAAAARLGCDRILVKPLPSFARGRDPDEVVSLLIASLARSGVPDDRVARVESERDGVERALAWLDDGDLALLLIHEDLDGALEALAQAGAIPA